MAMTICMVAIFFFSSVDFSMIGMQNPAHLWVKVTGHQRSSSEVGIHTAAEISHHCDKIGTLLKYDTWHLFDDSHEHFCKGIGTVCIYQFASQEMDNHSKCSSLNDVMYKENDIVSAGEEGTGIVIIVDLWKIALEFSTVTSPLSSLGTLPSVTLDRVRGIEI